MSLGNADDIGQCWESFRASLQSDKLAPGTMRIVRNAIEPWIQSLPVRRMAEVTPYMIEQWKTQRTSDGYAISTIRVEMTWLRRLTAWATRMEIVPRDPALNVRRPRRLHVTPAHRPLQLAEVRLLLDGCREQHRKLWASFICTGCRKMELLRLTWPEVDPHTHTVHLPAERTKCRVARDVYFGPRLAELWGSRGTGYVLVNSRGRPYGSRATLRALMRRVHSVGLDPSRLCVHSLRSTTSTLVQTELNQSLAVAKTLLGHSLASSGDITLAAYTEVFEPVARKAAEMLDELILG